MARGVSEQRHQAKVQIAVAAEVQSSAQAWNSSQQLGHVRLARAEVPDTPGDQRRMTPTAQQGNEGLSDPDSVLREPS